MPTTTPKISTWTRLGGTLDASQIDEVVRLGLPHFANMAIKDYDRNVLEQTEVGYNRGWLLIAQAWLQINEPSLLIDLDAQEEEAKKAQDRIVKNLRADAKKAETDSEAQRLMDLADLAQYDRKRHLVGPAVKNLRSQDVSWGEISVRLNTPESTCRASFDKVSEAKARGLRIGRGGRFAYQDPTLYLENRKAEGARIPIDYKGRPKVEDLLNYKAPKEAGTASANKGQRTKALNTIIKLRAKANDSAVTPEESEAFHAKADEIMAKWGFTVADLQGAKVA